MLSKAAYYMQDHIRRNYALLTDIVAPDVFMARGRQHFPQGLHAIAKIFTGRLPAHVYAHRYFMEKQSDPSQPSPQLHITEESQGILKVMGGMRYMRDSSSKLDGTVVFITDYDTIVKGRMLCVHEDDAKAAAGGPSSRGGRGGRGRRRSTNSVSMSERSGIGVGGGGFQGSMNASHGQNLGGVAHEPPVFPSPDDEDGSMVEQSKSYRFFHVALYPRAAPSTLHSSQKKKSSNDITNSDDDGMKKKKKATVEEEVFEPVFREREGGYTVLYCPVEVNDKTFADVVHKLHDEERVVAAIVLPTRHAWRHVQLWADAFPDAVILSSAEVPIEVAGDHGDQTQNPEAAGHHQQQRDTAGGCQDMGGGVTGLSFPEVDPAELLQASSTARGGEDPEMSASSYVPPPLSATASAHRPAAMPPHPDTLTCSSNTPFTNSLGNMDNEDALVDSILLHPGPIYLKQFVGLRRDDAHRVQVLSTPPPLPLPPQSTTALPIAHTLTPRLHLYHIPGDPGANEFVLYHTPTGTLACTELYHGAYSDLDPVNSWMCRVWFKFMKRGNHKRNDLVPRDKWLAIRYQKGGSLAQVRAAVELITRRLPIRCVLHAHGTPPLANEAVNTLRRQWGLRPLREQEIPPLAIMKAPTMYAEEAEEATKAGAVEEGMPAASSSSAVLG